MIEYEIFTSLLFFLVVFYKMNKGKNIDISHVCCFLFATYIMAVFFITDVGTVFDGFANGIDTDPLKFNLKPFSRHIYTPAYFANVLMFVPFGFFSSIIERKDIGIFRAAVEGFFFSLIIELSQVLNDRYTDVDDLIMNTSGAVLGYMVYRLIFGEKFPKEGKPKFEAFIYMTAMFCGRFFLFDEALYIKLFN
ncbi:MAG: VanZ family protein [Eubacteriales bacterium]